MAEFGVKCNFCRQIGSNLKRCTGCSNVYYCSKACQGSDWSVHRRVCKEPKQSEKRKERETDGGDKEVEEKSLKLHSGTKAQNAVRKVNECSHCGVLGNHKKCSRCKHACYCSPDCQENDWVVHKRMCKKKRSDFDERLMKSYKKKKNSNAFRTEDRNEINIYCGNGDYREYRYSHEQARIRASRPEGSLQDAIKKAKLRLPFFLIMTSFDEVPLEYNLDLDDILRDAVRPRCLLSFMYQYHEDTTRHGMYLKDDKDNVSKVEFYLDNYSDNPMPFFSWQQVKPGGYICMINPVMHVFEDRTIGFRVDDPFLVVLLDI